MSDLLKTNFLSSPSGCVKLVDHIHQASDLGTFSSLSLEKQKEAPITLLQKGVVFVVDVIQNSYVVTPFSAQLNELEKKDVDMTDKL